MLCRISMTDISTIRNGEGEKFRSRQYQTYNTALTHAPAVIQLHLIGLDFSQFFLQLFLIILFMPSTENMFICSDCVCNLQKAQRLF